MTRSNQLVTGQKNSTQPKKSFFKRFWYIWLFLGVGLIIFIISAISGIQNDLGRNNSLKSNAHNDIGKNNSLKYNKRVIKTFTPESGAAFKYNSPTLVDDFLYLGTSSKVSYEGDHEAVVAVLPDNYFYKMDLDFNIIWKYQFEKKMIAGGATLDSQGNIYFVTEAITANNNTADKDSFFLVTLNLVSLTNDGTFRWQKPISVENDKLDHGMFNCAVGTDDTIYVGHDRFYAFDTEGNIKWQYPDSDKKIIGFSSSPIIDSAGFVYFISPQPIEKTQDYNPEVIRAYKFNPASNVPVWSTVLGNEIRDNEGGNANGGGGQRANSVFSTPAFGVGERNLFAIAGCTISKVDTQSGQLLWSTKPEGASGHFNASPAIDENDNLYVGTKSNMESKFYAIKSDGTLLWKRDIGADMYTSPLLGDDNTVYAGSETLKDGKFHALDMKTGKTKWVIGGDNEAKIPDFSHGSMLLYKGYVYIGVHSVTDAGGRDEALFKIKVDANGYLPGAAWPRFHGSNANNGRKQ